MTRQGSNLLRLLKNPKLMIANLFDEFPIKNRIFNLKTVLKAILLGLHCQI